MDEDSIIFRKKFDDYEVVIPDCIGPSKEEREQTAVNIDKSYLKLYEALINNHKDPNEPGDKIPASDAILIIAQCATNRILPAIGQNISHYDMKLLRNIIQRHIAEVIFIEN